MDVERVMREDLAEARARLGIGRPEVYFECLRVLREEGVLEDDLMAPRMAAA